MTNWDKRDDITVMMRNWAWLLDAVILSVTSAIMLILIVAVYKRKELFLIVIPTLLGLQGLAKLPTSIHLLRDDQY